MGWGGGAGWRSEERGDTMWAKIKTGNEAMKDRNIMTTAQWCKQIKIEVKEESEKTKSTIKQSNPKKSNTCTGKQKK